MVESAKSNVQKHPVPTSVGETYTKRSGTAAVGEFYETKLLTMALFRLLHDEQIERFYMGSNLDEAGAFDDLVLRTSFGGKPHVYCLQAKHRRAGTTVNFNDLCNMQQSKGDFHLSKYFDSYLKIRHLFGPTSEHVMFRGEYEQTELELIIFTPAKLTFHGGKVEYEKPLLPSRNEQVEIVSDFLSKLRFYFEQDTEDVLDEVMVREIKSKDYECAEQIYAKSYAAVEHWWKQSGQQHQIAKFLQELVCIKKHTFPNLVTIARALLKRLLNIASKFYQEPAFRYLLGIVECALRLDADCFVKCKQIVTRKSKSHRSKLLLNASKAGYLGLVRLATDKKTIEMRGEAFSPFDFTALYFAASGGHESVVEHLLSNSANANGVSKCDITALHVASEHGNYKIVKLLLDSGADVNLKDHGGLIALHLAAQRGSNSVVELLVDRGSELDRSGFHELVDILLNSGYNVDCKSGSGNRTPLHEACSNGHLNVAKLLLNRGANATLETSVNGLTPLHMAARKDCPEIIKLLIDSGANVNSTIPDDGRTPLHEAAMFKAANAVITLLDLGANVHLASFDNACTPLHGAAQSDSAEIIKLLVEHGADINSATTDDGRTPLHVAVKNESVNAEG
ncbi:hypothetical protein pipiens_001122 [Culex pipiens pipiens]|uniref:Uncharacterized protein n=1 Tax=Culex pipiens pipiens TaxID=38569 RepID=A0ABD1DVP6_CULPP